MTESTDEADGRALRTAQAVRSAPQAAADFSTRVDPRMASARHPPAHGEEEMHGLVNRLDAVVSRMDEAHARWERRFASIEAGLHRTLAGSLPTHAPPPGMEEAATRVPATVERTVPAPRRELEVPDTAGHAITATGQAGESSRTAPQAMDTPRDPARERCACGEANEAFNSGVRVGFLWAVVAMMIVLVLAHAATS